MIIYSNGEKIESNCDIYDPFPEKKEDENETDEGEKVKSHIPSQDLQGL